MRLKSADVITNGISKEGGLYVPESFPKLSAADLELLAGKSYVERAKFVLSGFLTDFTESELNHCVENAYNTTKFSSDNIAEISHLYDGTYMLELWHGSKMSTRRKLLSFILKTASVRCKKDR